MQNIYKIGFYSQIDGNPDRVTLGKNPEVSIFLRGQSPGRSYAGKPYTDKQMNYKL